MSWGNGVRGSRKWNFGRWERCCCAINLSTLGTCPSLPATASASRAFAILIKTRLKVAQAVSKHCDYIRLRDTLAAIKLSLSLSLHSTTKPTTDYNRNCNNNNNNNNIMPTCGTETKKRQAEK